MIDLIRNNMKLLEKFGRPLMLWGAATSLAGCASLSGESRQSAVDAPQKIQVAVQSKWEKGEAESSAEYHFTLGQAYSHEGKVDRAIEEYRAALTYDPDSALLHSKLAAEYLKQGATAFAVEECQKSLKINPKSVEVRLMLGGIHAMNGETGLSLAEYEKVLKLDPENDEAAVFKTQVLAEKERYDEALKFIRGFTAKVTDSAAAWFYLGKLEQNKGRTSEAIRAFRKAIENRPGFHQAALALGLVFELHGENAKAIEVYQAQMDEKPEMQVAGRLVTLLLKGNRSEEALKLLSSMAAIDPEDMNVKLRMGLLRMQRNEWPLAREVFESILAKVPDSDKVHYYLAAVYEQEGKTSKTIEHLKRVSIDSRLFEDSNLHAAGIYRRGNEKGKAQELLRDAIKKSPENPGFYLMSASISEDEKDLKTASDTLLSGLKLFPEHEKMRYYYGAILDRQGKTDDALVQMLKLLEYVPDHADALNYVAYTWTVQGVRLKDAEEMLKRAIKLKPDNPFILDSFGWNQFVLGNDRNALIYLEKAVGLKGDEETILQHLAEAYARNRMPERAKETQVRIKNMQSREGDRVPASVESK